MKKGRMLKLIVFVCVVFISMPLMSQQFITSANTAVSGQLAELKILAGYLFVVISIVLFIVGIYTVATDSQNTKRTLISMGSAFLLMTIAYLMGFAL